MSKKKARHEVIMMIVNFGQIELDQIEEKSERLEESARQNLREHNSQEHSDIEVVDTIDDDSYGNKDDEE